VEVLPVARTLEQRDFDKEIRQFEREIRVNKMMRRPRIFWQSLRIRFATIFKQEFRPCFNTDLSIILGCDKKQEEEYIRWLVRQRWRAHEKTL
jgi:hypothetical protein